MEQRPSWFKCLGERRAGRGRGWELIFHGTDPAVALGAQSHMPLVEPLIFPQMCSSHPPCPSWGQSAAEYVHHCLTQWTSESLWTAPSCSFPQPGGHQLLPPLSPSSFIHSSPLHFSSSHCKWDGSEEVSAGSNMRSFRFLVLVLGICEDGNLQRWVLSRGQRMESW